MRTYSLSERERATSGFTDLFVLNAADGDFAAANYGSGQKLRTLAAGDVVYKVVMDVRTALVGPTGTPTVAIGVTGALTQFIGATSSVATGTAASSASPYVQATAKTLTYDPENGGGNGAAATAGEIWVWANISNAADRQTNLRG